MKLLSLLYQVSVDRDHIYISDKKSADLIFYLTPPSLEDLALQMITLHISL